MSFNFLKYFSLTTALLATTSSCFAMDPPLESSEERLGVPSSLPNTISSSTSSTEFYEKLCARYKQDIDHGFMTFCSETKEPLNTTKEERIVILANIFKDFPEAPQHFRKYMNDVKNEKYWDELEYCFKTARHLNEQQGLKVDVLTEEELAIWANYRDSSHNGLISLCTYVREFEGIPHLTPLLIEIFKDFPTAIQHFDETLYFEVGFFQHLNPKQFDNIKSSFLIALHKNRRKGITPELTVETLDGLSGRYWDATQCKRYYTNEANKKDHLKEAIWYSILAVKNGNDNSFSRLLAIINGKFSDKNEYRLFYTMFTPLLSQNDPAAQPLFNKVCRESLRAFEWGHNFVQELKSKGEKPGLSKCLEQAILNYYEYEFRNAMDLLANNPHDAIPKLYELELHTPLAKEELETWRTTKGYKNPKNALSDDDRGALLKKHELIIAKQRYIAYHLFMTSHIHQCTTKDIDQIDMTVEHLHFAANLGHREAIIAEKKLKKSKGYQDAKKGIALSNPINVAYVLGQRYWLYEQKQLTEIQQKHSIQQTPQKDEKEISLPVQSITPVQETTSVNKEEQNKKNKQTSKKKQNPRRKGKASKVAQKKKDQGPSLQQNNILETNNPGREEPTDVLNSVMLDVMKDIDLAYAALTPIVPVDASGKPTTSMPLPSLHELEFKDKKGEVAITTEVPTSIDVPDVVDVPNLTKVPQNIEIPSLPKASGSDEDTPLKKDKPKVKQSEKTLDFKMIKRKGEDLLESARLVKTIVFSKDPQAKAKNKFLNTAQISVKTIEQPAPKKELEFCSTTESDDSPKRIKRQNSNKNLKDRQNPVKELKRRKSELQLERRKSEKQLALPPTVPTTELTHHFKQLEKALQKRDLKKISDVVLSEAIIRSVLTGLEDTVTWTWKDNVISATKNDDEHVHITIHTHDSPAEKWYAKAAVVNHFLKFVSQCNDRLGRMIEKIGK